MIAVINDSVA